MNIQAVRGMPDVLPADAARWGYVEHQVRRLFASYGLVQIRTPIVEDTGLFARSIGDATDIVEKEMYSFEDRSGESLTLRPELTAGVVRAAIEHGLLHNQTQRLWYQGPAFRYERPQKGRYRQFHQIGVECFGIADAMMDAELIELTDRLWRVLGIRDAVTLQLNSIGSLEARHRYKEALVTFLEHHRDGLDVDSQARIQRNPMRVLDSKDPSTQQILVDAPSILDALTDEDRSHFDRLCKALNDAGVPFVINDRLVRGLDYYGRTVFEWTTDQLGAQGTVCGGGRYDGLVAHLGGRSTPGVGFAIGVERLVLLMETLDVFPDELSRDCEVYLMMQSADAEPALRRLAASIRETAPDVRVLTHIGDGSLKSQLKKADKSGALVGLIIGQEELLHDQVQLKPLRGGESQTVSHADAIAYCQQLRKASWII